MFMKILFLILSFANAWACPDFTGSQYACEGNDENLLVGMFALNSILIAPGLYLPLNGESQVRPEGGRRSGHCRGDRIMLLERARGNLARTNLQVLPDRIIVSGDPVERDCEGIEGCVPGPIRSDLTPQSLTCRKK